MYVPIHLASFHIRYIMVFFILSPGYQHNQVACKHKDPICDRNGKEKNHPIKNVVPDSAVQLNGKT